VRPDEEVRRRCEDVGGMSRSVRPQEADLTAMIWILLDENSFESEDQQRRLASRHTERLSSILMEGSRFSVFILPQVLHLFGFALRIERKHSSIAVLHVLYAAERDEWHEIASRNEF
jgi:hypothetical protein